MSESFDEVCTSYGDCTWIGRDIVKEVIARLQTAHEREIAEALCDACDQCDRMDKKAYEHKIEQIRKARFHEGYVAGQRSMDAEHRAVAMRLRGLRFDGGSHENLNKIAYAIYPCATGWTVESCEGLRDKIIDLLGGVHECGADCGGCGAGCDCADSGGGEQEAVDVDDSVPDVRADVPDSDGVADSAFTQVMYDVLGNERHKAVCELRKLPDCYTHDGKQSPAGKFNEALSDAIGVMGLPSFAKIRDRLIHLLGGDEPTAMEYIQRIVREHDIRCSDMEPSGAELSQASVDAMSRRAKSCKCGETIKSVGECDGKIMESGENHQIEATITDELRERIAAVCKVSGLSGEKLYGIADRIDEQFERICEQHEAVLQHTIDDMVDERDELQAKLEEADAAIANYREREKSFAESERQREELQAKLDAIREAMDE